MKQVMIGDVVRQCRVGKGITQEQLSTGICSVSTLSRIENGQQYPTRSIFTLLVERMGEEGIMYDEFLGDYDYEIYDLTNRIITCLDRGELSEADSYLDKLRFIIGNEDDVEIKGKCIYHFAELLTASVEWNRERDEEENIELHQYGYYLYEEINKLLEICTKQDEERDDVGLDKMENRMYNLMGYAKFIQGNYKEAIDIWANLIDDYRKKGFDRIEFPKERASLYCNISAALSALGMYDEAEIFSEMGLKLCFDGGGLRLVNRLLHNRMYCLMRKGDKNKAYVDLVFSKAICTCCKKDMLKDEKLKKLPNKPYIIQVF